MSQLSQRCIWPIVYLFLWSSSFAETVKGATVSASELDFDSDGLIDANDLLSLLERVGASIGEEKYSVRHDLETDGSIDDQDLFQFLYGWKEAPGRGEPISTEEFRERSGLNELSGATWRFRCLSGGTQDCTGEERTVTGGPLTEIDGRTVLPIIWGSANGEPWDILYVTMDGNLAYMEIEKVAEPDGFPGVTIPPQTMGLSGSIPWTTSEMIYPGSIVESSGVASVQLAVLKGSFNQFDFFCSVSNGMENYYRYLERELCHSYATDMFQHIACDYAFPSLKGPADYPILYSGTGILESTDGLRAQADWDLLFGREGLLFIQFCWDFLGQKKCLSYGRIFDASGSNCVSSIPEQEVEIEHCGVLHNDITEGECLTGFVGSGIDIQDWVRLNQGAAGRVAVTIRHSVPQGSEGLAQLWRFPPECSAGDLLDFANFTGDGEAVVESPFITVGPTKVYVIVSPDGDQGAAGGPIAYEVQFTNQ